MLRTDSVSAPTIMAIRSLPSLLQCILLIVPVDAGAFHIHFYNSASG